MKRLFLLAILTLSLFFAQGLLNIKAQALTPLRPSEEKSQGISIVRVTPKDGEKDVDSKHTLTIEIKFNDPQEILNKGKSYITVNGNKRSFDVEPVNFAPQTYLLMAGSGIYSYEEVTVEAYLYGTMGSQASTKWKYDVNPGYTICHAKNGDRISCEENYGLAEYLLLILICCCLPLLLLSAIIGIVVVLIRRRKNENLKP